MPQGATTPAEAIRALVTARRRSSQPKPSERDALSERDIIATALRMLQHEGRTALSMRKLATELRVTPMAIYYHVPHKRALIERLSDSLLESVPTPEPSGVHWEQELKRTALAGWQRLAAYPGLCAAALEQGPSKQARKLLRYHTSILVAAGFDPRAAALAVTAYNTFVYGMLSGQRNMARRLKRGGKSSDIESYLERLDPRALMDYGLDTLIAGLRVQLAQAGKKPGAAARAKRTRTLQQPSG
jgi:AcrR family transcriptional regulator